jgi:hypothetical protein
MEAALVWENLLFLSRKDVRECEEQRYNIQPVMVAGSKFVKLLVEGISQ